MRRPTHNTTHRDGVTLVEVLMSLMIMSIGVALVASLFPVAALRSAQATKMTNAAILKYNVETLVDLNDEFIFDPDGDYAFAATDAARIAALNEHYRPVQLRNYIIDPSGFVAHAENGLTSSGPAVAVPTTFCNWFGNQGSAMPYVNTATQTGLRRYDAGMQAQYALLAGATAAEQKAMRLIAKGFTSLGDGWDTVVDEASFTLVAGGVTFPAEVPLDSVVAGEDFIPRDASTAILSPDPEIFRVVVFSPIQNSSVEFPLTRISGQTVYWTEDTEDLNQDGLITTSRPLPSTFGGAAGRVLIQKRRDSDFNWLLTVRRGGDSRALGIDVVVLFNSGVEPNDEWVYTASTDVDDDATADGGFVAGQFLLQGSRGTGDPEPTLKKGLYALDVHNGRWYRVQDYIETSATTFDVQFETEIVEGSPAGSGIIFLPGVIDVFPLGGRDIPDALENTLFR